MTYTLTIYYVPTPHQQILPPLWQADSLTIYQGHTVGFCNPGCRNEFASNPDAYPSDRTYFDTLLKEYELSEP